MPVPVIHVITMVVAHRLVLLFSVIVRVLTLELNAQVQAVVSVSINERLLFEERSF